MRRVEGVLENEHLVIRNDEVTAFSGCVLRNCDVELRIAGANLILADCRFEGCRVVAKRRLARAWWDGAQLVDCTLSGTFSENRFGCAPDDVTPGRLEGSVESCDFSGAVLSYCEFDNTDLAGHELPGWPCYTLERGHDAALRSLPWPGELEFFVRDAPRRPRAVAVTYHVPTLLKDHDFDPDQLRALLTGVEGVHL